MAKVIIKSEKITSFGGIFHVREMFSRYVSPVIDKVLGLRCKSVGYQYSEIVGSLFSVYFCDGDCVEDVTSLLMPHLSLHPTLRTCSSDTIRKILKINVFMYKWPKIKGIRIMPLSLFSEPEGIRTLDPQLRRLLLYPAELPVHLFLKFVLAFFESGCKFTNNY